MLKFDDFAHKILDAIRRYDMFSMGDSVVVGVSGGPDSVVLLHVLKRLQGVLCLDVAVAHLDHQVRRGSHADYRFVAELSAALGFPFFGGVLSRNKISKKGSLEDQLRVHRYAFLKSVCRKVGAKKIVLAHTRDDQAETVLMRMLRGSGLYGLSAIQPKLLLEGVEVVRPFIEAGKDEILRTASLSSIAFRTDATNADEKFFRNKIRRNLLPLLEKEYNPNIREVLASMARTVGADYAYLAKEARKFLDRHSVMRQGRCSIDLQALSRTDVSLRRLALRLATEAVRGDLCRVSFKHMEEAENLIFSRPTGAVVHLPGGLAIKKTGESLVIFKR